MKSLDEYDIRESFMALDADCKDSITVDDLYTIYLALGYQPDDLTLQSFQQRAGLGQDEQLSIERVLQILSKFSCDSNYNRTKNLKECFHLIGGVESKEYLTRDDILKVAEDVLGNGSITDKIAKNMIDFCSKNNTSGVSLDDFHYLLSPPEP